MAEKLTVRLHPLACDRAEEVAFGRWLRNEAVTVEEIREHCGKEIAGRVVGRHVLAIQDTTELIDELAAKGYRRGSDIVYLEVAGGRHDQATWGAVMPDFLTWLFPT